MIIVFGKSFLYTCATTTIAIPSIMNIFPRDSIMCIITIHIMSVYGMYTRHDLHCQIELTIRPLRYITTCFKVGKRSIGRMWLIRWLVEAALKVG